MPSVIWWSEFVGVFRNAEICTVYVIFIIIIIIIIIIIWLHVLVG
jgi:hypothetical protein